MSQSEVDEEKQQKLPENENIDKIIEENLLTMCCNDEDERYGEEIDVNNTTK